MILHIYCKIPKIPYSRNAKLIANLMAIFVRFSLFLANILVSWKRLLEPCNQECLIWIGWPWKPRAINNHILVISRRNTFIAILVPKFAATLTPLCPLYTGVSPCEFLDSWNPISTQNCIDMSHTTEVMAIFVIFCPFWQTFGCHGPHSIAFFGLVDHEIPHSRYLSLKCTALIAIFVT